MPLFDFKCKDCSKIFEELIFNNNEVLHCPDCNGGVEKLPIVKTPAVHFIGEGWTTPGSNTLAGTKKETDRLKLINEGNPSKRYY